MDELHSSIFGTYNAYLVLLHTIEQGCQMVHIFSYQRAQFGHHLNLLVYFMAIVFVS
jgi:hypothetical protein